MFFALSHLKISCSDFDLQQQSYFLQSFIHQFVLTHCIQRCLAMSHTIVCKVVLQNRLCLSAINCVVHEALSGCKLLGVFQFVFYYNLRTRGAMKKLKRYEKGYFAPPGLMFFLDFSKVTVTYYSMATVAFYLVYAV